MDNDEREPIDPAVVDRVKAELNELDREFINIEGNLLKASQCYHFDVNPLHVLFNTNCPDTLKEKVNAIISKYISPEEDNTKDQGPIAG